MEKMLIQKTEEKIKEILEQDINASNVENLYKLSKIRHMAKEDECMNYGNYSGYGNYGNYGNYGRRPGYDSYGRRGRDMKYRGDEELDRMSGEYGRYMESRSYGAAEESDKSFHYMVKALEDFIKVLEEEAETQEQKMQLRQALQNSMR